jgi:hypothetical protein
MNETRPLGAAGLESVSTLGRCDTQTFSPNTSIAQAILIREDLAANIGAMSATLNAALAMRDANDDCGLIYALRRARAYWQAIAASARDLASLQHKGAE